MAATYISPIIQPPEHGFHVASVVLNYDLTIIVVNVKRDPSGEEVPIRVASQQDVDVGRAEFTFAQFMAVVSDGPLATLNQRIEQALIDAGRFPPAIVT